MSKFSINQTAATTLWLAAVLILLDQITKYLAITLLVQGVPVAVMPSLNMTLAYNYGAAFGFLADMGGWQRWFLSTIAIVISIVLIVWLTKLPKKWTTEVVGLNLILSGAIGNVIDRVLEGRVTDFIDFYIGNWHYATFNIADMAITIGAGLLLWSELWVKPKAEKAAKKAGNKSLSSK